MLALYKDLCKYQIYINYDSPSVHHTRLFAYYVQEISVVVIIPRNLLAVKSPLLCPIKIAPPFLILWDQNLLEYDLSSNVSDFLFLHKPYCIIDYVFIYIYISVVVQFIPTFSDYITMPIAW